MSANLITGDLFSPITAAQDSDFQAGINGNVTQILAVGSEMALTISDASTISCADGVIVTKEGRRIQIDNGSTEEFTIPTGTQGTTAYYIIGFHLYTDSDTAAQLCETFVEAVESSSSTITENTFRDGYTEVYVSLGMVVQDGVSIDSVTSLLDVQTTISELNSNLGGILFRINNSKPEISIDNGSTWTELGGGSMPDLNYTTPLHTFSSGNLTYTATGECYLVGCFNSNQGGGSITINDHAYYTSGPTTFGYRPIPDKRLKSGDVVTVTFDNPYLYVLDLA